MGDRLDDLKELIGKMTPNMPVDALNLILEELQYLRGEIERTADHLHEKFGERP